MEVEDSDWRAGRRERLTRAPATMTVGRCAGSLIDVILERRTDRFDERRRQDAIGWLCGDTSRV
jgi:hypothetical protein